MKFTYIDIRMWNCGLQEWCEGLPTVSTCLRASWCTQTFVFFTVTGHLQFASQIQLIIHYKIVSWQYHYFLLRQHNLQFYIIFFATNFIIFIRQSVLRTDLAMCFFRQLVTSDFSKRPVYSICYQAAGFEISLEHLV